MRVHVRGFACVCVCVCVHVRVCVCREAGRTGVVVAVEEGVVVVAFFKVMLIATVVQCSYS